MKIRVQAIGKVNHAKIVKVTLTLYYVRTVSKFVGNVKIENISYLLGIFC